MPAPPMPGGLYAIADADACQARGLDLERVARALLSGPKAPSALQVRFKDRPAGQYVEILRALRPPCSQRGVLLFANDRADVAVLAGCDGVHVGQEDLDVASVRRHFPELRVGLSTHDPEQLRAGIAERPDYVALGPVHGTASKTNPDPEVGLPLLRQLAVEAAQAGVPLLAIGGITEERLAPVREVAQLWAVIGALLPDGATDPLDEAIARRVAALS